jgi:hypothetical protein
MGKLGLRFDKVVVRLLSGIRESITKDIPGKTSVLFTIAAPIKLPSKTELEVRKHIDEYLNHEEKYGEQELIVFQNKVLIRKVKVPITQPIKFAGFVHNQNSKPKQLLDFATIWLQKN